MAMKRSGKFYRNNEAQVMKSLGLTPTKNSGSGWIEKEDGQSEHVICQLKSTDANSIKVNKKDLDDIINDGEAIEVKCQFCNHAYGFNVEELKEIRK